MSSSCGMGAVVMWLDGAVVVTSVNPQGPAGASGEVLVGDCILEVGGTKVISVEQARSLILGPIGSKFVLKLKRNMTSLGFDTFHVLIERRPPTAPNSPQTPTHRGLSAPATTALSVLSRSDHDPNGTGSQKSVPVEAVTVFSSSTASNAVSPSNLRDEAKSMDCSEVVMNCAVDAEIGRLQQASAFSNVQASHISADRSSSNDIATITRSAFTAPAVNAEAGNSASGFADPDSPATLTTPMQVSGHQQLHIASARQATSLASCNRKLQLDIDGQEPCANMPSLHPHGNVITTAKDHFSSQFKPICSTHSPVSPSASEIVAVESAVSLAAAAQEKEAIASWISSQAHEISATCSPPSSGDQEVLEQRREEQRVWGMVNSKILSDLMKSMGSKSIFNH